MPDVYAHAVVFHGVYNLADNRASRRLNAQRLLHFTDVVGAGVCTFNTWWQTVILMNMVVISTMNIIYRRQTKHTFLKVSYPDDIW